MFKNKSAADIIALEMDQILNDDKFKKSTSNDFSSVLNQDPINKPFIREASEIVEIEIEDNNFIEEKIAEVKNVINTLISLSEKLDNLGFVKSSLNTAYIVEQLLKEAGDDPEEFFIRSLLHKEPNENEFLDKEKLIEFRSALHKEDNGEFIPDELVIEELDADDDGLNETEAEIIAQIKKRINESDSFEEEPEEEMFLAAFKELELIKNADQDPAEGLDVSKEVSEIEAGLNAQKSPEEQKKIAHELKISQMQSLVNTLLEQNNDNHQQLEPDGGWGPLTQSALTHINKVYPNKASNPFKLVEFNKWSDKDLDYNISVLNDLIKNTKNQQVLQAYNELNEWIKNS
jgi:hypothetical protein